MFVYCFTSHLKMLCLSFVSCLCCDKHGHRETSSHVSKDDLWESLKTTSKLDTHNILISPSIFLIHDRIKDLFFFPLNDFYKRRSFFFFAPATETISKFIINVLQLAWQFFCYSLIQDYDTTATKTVCDCIKTSSLSSTILVGCSLYPKT